MYNVIYIYIYICIYTLYYIYIYIYICICICTCICIHTGQDVCDVLPARDPPEGISFSNELPWTIRFVLFLGIMRLSQHFV